VLGAEGADRFRVAGDQGRRHQVGELGDEDFLGRVAHPVRVVDDQRAFGQALQDVGRRDVAHVEGRVLAQVHHVHGAKVERLHLAQREVVAAFVAHGQRLRAGGNFAVALSQVLGQVVPELVAAVLRFERDGEGGVAADVDAIDRVHLNGDGEGHALSRLLAGGQLSGARGVIIPGLVSVGRFPQRRQTPEDGEGRKPRQTPSRALRRGTHQSAVSNQTSVWVPCFRLGGLA
jgi:hypothetical protein